MPKTARPFASLYGHQWRKAREAFLAENPLCLYCSQAGKLTPATVVDHIVPHKGDEVLFWNSATNWAGLCVTHHNASKQRAERRGHAIGCDASGVPLDPLHGWRKG